MVEFLGWVGFLLFGGTLVPFVLRRISPRSRKGSFFSRNHHNLALATLGVLTLHGLTALYWSRGRGHGWGAGAHFSGDVTSGVLAWLLLLAICLLALAASRRKPFPRTHCWLVIALLAILFLYHL